LATCEPAARRPAVATALIVGCAGFIQAFDSNAITVALPPMAEAFGVPALSLNLVITAYLVGAASCLPACGWISERYGARRVFLAALALFAVTSAACAASPSITMLVLSRFVQGAAGALLLPVGRMIVLSAVPKSEFLAAMSLLTTPVMIGPVLGPLLGGLIVEAASWRWVFMLNVPLALLALAGVWKFVPELPRRAVAPLDWRGFGLLAIGLTGITLGIGMLGRDDPAFGASLLLIGAVAVALYVFHARRHPHSLIDFSLFRVQSFAATNLGGLFMRMLVSGTPFLLALLFQIGFGLSPAEAGGIILSMAVGSVLGRTALLHLLKVMRFRTLLIANLVLSAALVAACGLLTADTPYPVMVVLLFLSGVMRSLALIAMMTLSYADIAPEDFPSASTISSLSQQLALSLGIALSVILLQFGQPLTGSNGLNADVIRLAFPGLGLASLLSLAWIARLPASVGASLSSGVVKRRQQVVEEET
jgi:EmrB/QacA subfamily drug resistance transporter